MKKLRRTMLFMPGNNPGMLQNAPILGADAVILDLEDAVSLTEKDAARALVSGAIKNLDYSQVELVVRVNPLDTEDRKSTRLNSSHANISYAVFCLKKKNIHAS